MCVVVLVGAAWPQGARYARCARICATGPLLAFLTLSQQERPGGRSWTVIGPTGVGLGGNGTLFGGLRPCQVLRQRGVELLRLVKVRTVP
jgi:hypothetical protein